jgi:hypothetical protein
LPWLCFLSIVKVQILLFDLELFQEFIKKHVEPITFAIMSSSSGVKGSVRRSGSEKRRFLASDAVTAATGMCMTFVPDQKSKGLLRALFV